MEKKTIEEIRMDLLEQEDNDDYKDLVDYIHPIDIDTLIIKREQDEQQ